MLRSPGLQHFVDAGAMGAVAASGTTSGAAPLCSSCTGSITFIEFYCPPTQNFRENLLLEKQAFLNDKLLLSFGFMVEGIPNTYFGISYKDIHPILVVNLFTCIPKS